MNALRTLAEWLRNRRAPKPVVVRGWLLRAESEAMLDWASAFQKQSDKLFTEADAAPHLSPEQFGLTFLAYALDCDARALWWRAGGDDEAAAEYQIAAAEWRAKAAQFVEVAHAPAF